MTDTDRADAAVRYALNSARRDANFMRLNRVELDSFGTGYTYGNVCGQLLVAEHDMRADPLLAQAARNEIQFLLVGGYVERGRA